MSKELEMQFDDAMMSVYRRARSECDYNATRFLNMLHDLRVNRFLSKFMRAWGQEGRANDD